MKVEIQTKTVTKITNLNRRKAIRALCLNCTGWERKRVAHCQLTDCALNPFRSGTGKQDSMARAKAIRTYCLSCMNGQQVEVKKCTCRDCPLFAYRMCKVDRSIEMKSDVRKDDISDSLSTEEILAEYFKRRDRRRKIEISQARRAAGVIS